MPSPRKSALNRGARRSSDAKVGSRRAGFRAGPVREGDFPMKRVWVALLGVTFVGVMFAGSPAIVGAAPPAKKEAKEAPLKAVPALKAKVEEKIAPFKWGMTS